MVSDCVACSMARITHGVLVPCFDLELRLTYLLLLFLPYDFVQIKRGQLLIAKYFLQRQHVVWDRRC